MTPLNPLLQKSFRRAHLISGLILFAYVLMHFINHMTGLVSLEAMTTVLRWNGKIWSNVPGRQLLYSALTLHIGLALWAIYRRRSLHMPVAELLQTVLGFSVPFLAAQHVVNTLVGELLFDSALDYPWEVLSFWVLHPSDGLIQVTLLLVVWLHACIGLHFWLKLKPWFPTARQTLFALALLIPALAILGFVAAGRAVETLAQNPDWLAAAREHALVPPPAVQDRLYQIRDAVWAGMLILIAATLLARGVRWLILSRKGVVIVTYANGRRVPVLPGTSILEASRDASIPHASICGGRGRCSTCRIRVTGAANALGEPSAHELHVLRRVSAAPNVRLACQLRPTGDVFVTPLLPATATARDGFARPAQLQGEERQIAILFADIRGFTQIAEHKLPYDVVFLLNRYFFEMGMAVEMAGGHVDKFIGDGVMALFGMEGDIETACCRALTAAAAMSHRLDELNRLLAADLAAPMRIGIGIHAGLVIVGEMGFGATVSLTAVGDAVNTASRLEALCKTYGCELVVSQDLAQWAGIDLSAFGHHEIDIRGRQTPMAIHAIPRAGDVQQAQAGSSRPDVAASGGQPA